MDNDNPEAIKAALKQGVKVDQNQILAELRKCESSPPEYLTITSADREEHRINIFYSDDDSETIAATPEREFKSPFTGEMITVPAHPERKGGKMEIVICLDPSYENFTKTEIERYKQNFERVFKDYDYCLTLGNYFYNTNDIEEMAHIVSFIFRDVYQHRGHLKFEREGDFVASSIGYNEKSGSCFIATAVYGDYDHPQVIRLRAFRDHFLSVSIFGRLLIKIYYSVGPYLAILPTRSRVTKRLLRLILDRL
jgi:hypothetical protein